MKQSYIIHEHHPRLLLFFAGWGADETPFKMYRPAASDFMVCYDYRTLDFDASGLEEYREINLIGWSMGVWAASQTVPQLSSPGTSGEGIHMANSIAINGTPYPIDQHMGIPPAIYHGTLDGLTGASLHKFLRRMCANGAASQKGKVLLENSSVRRDNVYLPRNHLTACRECIFHRLLDSSAARHFHADHGNALNIVLRNDLGQLLRIIHIV